MLIIQKKVRIKNKMNFPFPKLKLKGVNEKRKNKKSIVQT